MARKGTTGKTISIGVQAACKFNCPVRMPLLVFAKRLEIDVVDGGDLEAARRGTSIHAAFQKVTENFLFTGQALQQEDIAALQIALESEIASSVNSFSEETVKEHASNLASSLIEITNSTRGYSPPVHEKQVSVKLTPRVMLTGRIDTLFSNGLDLLLVERKSGRVHRWHETQVQLYGEMIKKKGTLVQDIVLELWYSLHGRRRVTSTSGELLRLFRTGAKEGEALTLDQATVLFKNHCFTCQNNECGMKRVAATLM